MTDPHPPPLRALQEDGHLAQTSVKEDTLSRRGTSVGRANRRANSVQTHFFDSGSAAAVGRQERWTQRLFVWLAKGGRNGGKLRQQRLRASSARGGQEKALRCIAGCAELRAGEATYARGRKCENALELRGKRAPAEFPGQAIARESTLAQGDGFMGALGCTQRTRGRKRVGSALE